MITDATPNAAPNQKSGESAATNMTTAPTTAQTLKTIADDQVDDLGLVGASEVRPSAYAPGPGRLR